MVKTLSKKTIDECLRIYDPDLGLGDKMKSIYHLRVETGLDLKEAKEIIESNFDPKLAITFSVVIGDTTTPGYYIDRIFELSAELAECHNKLKEMGFSFTS